MLPARRSAWLVIAIAVLTVFHWWNYGDLVHRFFAFDDFLLLDVVYRARVERAIDVVRLFAPIEYFEQYRPLTQTVYFWLQRAAWGVNPVGWMSTHLALQVVNGLLVYDIAATVLGSGALGVAAALVYASAPGHALAVRWLSFATIPGTALVYFAGLALWLRMQPPWRAPAALAMFVVALNCSEHGVGFPIALTVVAVLLERRRDGWRLARELAPLYLVMVAYVGARVAYLYLVLPRLAPLKAQFFRASYGMSFAPAAFLATLGQYVTGALPVLLPLELATPGYRIVGAATLGLAVVVSLAALRRGAGTRTRATALGLDLFLVGIAPVVLLPQHVHLAYVGIAALGMALAVTAAASALPGGTVVALGVAAVLAAVDLRTASPLARQQEDFTVVDRSATLAVQWLTTIAQRAAADPSIREFVVPADPNTNRLFGSAHRLFLCASYDVRTVPRVEDSPPAPGRVRLARPDRVPGDAREFLTVRPACP